jgi:LDH2 family malate/lactate/ureidoglycolate dehydrogenase
MSEIAIKALRELCLQALIGTGLSETDAAVTADHYLENECSGKKSHGMVRVVEAVKVLNKNGVSDKAPEIVLDKGNIAVIEGHMNLGPVIGRMVVDEAIKRAKEHGLSFVGGRHYIANSGSMAYYLRRLAEQNIIGLMSCNSAPMVAAPDGIQRLVGTNPIGLGVPSADGHHFIADFATSAIAYGKIMVAVDKGESLPEGRIIDKDGNPSTNPEDAKKDGAILPLADYRGFALGLFVELLAAAIGAATIEKNWFGEDGFFIIAIDPSHLGSAGYTAQVQDILTQIRDSAPAPSHERVTIPGDRSAAVLKQTLASGMVDVADKTLENIQNFARKEAA